MEPSIIGYGNLASWYTAVGRIKDAKAILADAQQKGFDGFLLRADDYNLAFIEGNDAAMERDVAWAAGRPGEEDFMINAHADTMA
ncbi:hypothetical protein Q8G48_28265, partial [Klebsiella pneumoniae]|uniref:hypothetical protein n=1 Tax=Klebsiella pneumoniae TaxID=573 RepID=UPI0030135B52